jgi:hypothetical protein
VQIVFETPRSQIIRKIVTRKDVKTNEVTPNVGIWGGGVVRGIGNCSVGGVFVGY